MEEIEPVMPDVAVSKTNKVPTSDAGVAHGTKSAAASRRSRSAQSSQKSLSGAQDSPVGSVLRSIYQQTVGEDIPAEMLDLLNKLD